MGDFVFTYGWIFVLILILGGMILILRLSGLVKPAPRAKTQAISPGTWAFIAYAVAVAVVLMMFQEGSLALSRPASVVLFLVALGVPVAGLMLYPSFARDPVLARVRRRGDRGDLTGAIAELQAELDRHPAGVDAPPASLAANPWAPPGQAIQPDLRRAGRLNLMGRLHGARGDWLAALNWFRQAERVAGSVPSSRLNIGLALVKLGQHAEGLAAMSATGVAPEVKPLARFELALLTAQALADLERWGEAETRLDEAAAALEAAHVFPDSLRKRLTQEVATTRDRLPRVPLPGLDPAETRA